MISASGSNPLERCSWSALILRVIQLMNDPGPEALADPTLIMLREPHLGGTEGTLLTQIQRRSRSPVVQSSVFHADQSMIHCISLVKEKVLKASSERTLLLGREHIAQCASESH